MNRILVATACTLILSASIATAEDAGTSIAPASQVGLSPEGLADVGKRLQREVDEGRIAGAVAAISRHGRVAYLESFGHADLDARRPMAPDALFRIASMTKAVTSVGIMTLVEDGAISLDDPVSKFLPAFSEPKLFGRDAKSCGVPTIHDLLTHRSGLTYGWFGPPELDAVYTHHRANEFFTPIAETLAARVNRIAKLPLKFEPGTAWDYGVSTDVLGRVIEVASGMNLGHFLRERIFRPLGMRDTFFQVPESKQDRLASLYTIDDQQSLTRVSEQPVTAGFLTFSDDFCSRGGREFCSGGAGLVSSTGDYLRFLHMLLGNGTLDGVRILRPDTVAAMTAQQIGAMTIPFAGHGDGFGFGFGVLTDRGVASDVASTGTFSWGGIFNTYFWVDPQEKFVGLLMTQLFPYDHLQLREDFKQLAYAAIDDSGFEHVYWYQPGEESANPFFNGRQLRVNAAEVSTHPKFSVRSEPRSSGMARILIDEDLRTVRRVDLQAEIWGGHPGTADKRVCINGRSTHELPRVGTEQEHCTHQYPAVNLRPEDLVNGYNSLQFACDTGETFWGHYIVDEVALRVGLRDDDPRLAEAGLDGFSSRVAAQPLPDGQGFRLRLNVDSGRPESIAAVHFEARYFGFDENGNAYQTDWHGMTKQRSPYGHLGTVSEAPLQLDWDTTMLPAQERVAVRAVVEFKGRPELRYRTRVIGGLSIDHGEAIAVSLFHSHDSPRPFWSRDNNEKECTIHLDVPAGEAVAAEIHVVAWTGGAGNVDNYFTLNGHPFAVAEGHEHETVYSKVDVPVSILRDGENTIRLLSDTEHHGIEIMKPGPVLLVRHNLREPIKLTRSAIDASAGGLECFKVETPNATYFLEKVGGGLSSLLDRDRHDWIGFHPRPDSGAMGEYRGFPNAVFQEAGSYFHPRNAGTDPCVTRVVEESPDRVVISAEADNGLWAGTYTFTQESCTFTLTKKPAGHNYWVLYEGTPGGSYDDTDWWMTADSGKHPMTTRHDGDLPATAGAEWIAFGDPRLSRALVLSHEQDDDSPDHFYQMQQRMTVFGFGRRRMEKHLDSVPQSFSIRLIESDEPAVLLAAMQQRDPSGDDGEETKVATQQRRKALESFAMSHAGDAKAGKQLFENKTLQCAKCHKVGGSPSGIGPELTRIAGKYDRPHLIESLLYPSKQIGYDYAATTVLTTDGRVITGIAKEIRDESLVIVDAENKRIPLATDDIEDQKPSKVSLMPDNIADQLSPEQFTDVVAYLETLRPAKPGLGGGISGPIRLPEGFEVTTVATGLSGAVALDVAPDGRVFVCEQGGTLRVVKNDVLLDEPFVKIPVELNWERGLIGVTVAPDFPEDPSVYVVYVTDKPYTHHRISRFIADGDVAAEGSEQILFRGDDQKLFGGNKPSGHQGGAIHFGTDGKLYIGLGEQTAKTPSQRMDALQGKILRLNPDGSIPSDNPFLEKTEGKYGAIWAMGCRNPFTLAVRRTTGDIFINDVGGKYEEINVGRAGANYGWPKVDHGPTNAKGVTGPIHIYPQASINGGDFSDTATDWPDAFRGKYFFADFVHGWIKCLDPADPKKATEFALGIRRPVDIRFADDGSLYVLLRNAWVVDDKFQGGTGSLLKIRYRP